MATNLLDMLSRSITPELASSLGRAVGSPQGSVMSAAGALLPALLGGMAQKASTAEGASSLFSLLTGSGVDSSIESNVGNLLASGQTSNLTQVGTQLLGGLFGGDRTAALGNSLGEATGLSGASARSLLLMLAPMIFGMLKKFVVGNRLDAGGVAALLRGQAPFLEGKLDGRLTSALGLGAPSAFLAGLGDRAASAASATAGAVGSVAAGAGAVAVEGASGLRRWLPWVIGGAIALFLLSQLGRCTDKPAAPAVATPAPAPMTATPPASPVAMAVAGMPAKVYFATGMATIDAKGSEAVATAAKWLKDDAGRKVALTGYTDKTGDTATNEKLAKDRALAVRAALEAAGVAGDRIEMKAPMFVEVGANMAEAEARRVDISAN